ncbi:MAG: hypothetical protein F6K23_38080 [Okeania sp. SIO2C9]|nr:hypothetical protein [Okeania sp. SIO2C9]
MGTHPRTPPVEGNVGRWGVWEKLKNIYPHHYHAGLPKTGIKAVHSDS